MSLLNLGRPWRKRFCKRRSSCLSSCENRPAESRWTGIIRNLYAKRGKGSGFVFFTSEEGRVSKHTGSIWKLKGWKSMEKQNVARPLPQNSEEHHFGLGQPPPFLPHSGNSTSKISHVSCDIPMACVPLHSKMPV